MANGAPWLRIWVMIAALSSTASVTFAGGSGYIILAAATGIILGHVYSWYRRGQASHRPLLVLGVLFIVLVFLIRDELRLSLTGPILPLAHLFLIGLALGSFELRSRASMYRSLALSGFTVLIASEAAVALGFLLSLGIFVLSTVAALATANLADRSAGATRIPSGKRFRLVPFWLGSILAFLVLSILLVWSFPRLSILSQAAPSYLPSHMEVVGDIPPPPLSEPGDAPSILPSDPPPPPPGQSDDAGGAILGDPISGPPGGPGDADSAAPGAADGAVIGGPIPEPPAVPISEQSGQSGGAVSIVPRESTVEGPGRGVSLLPGARLRIAGTPQKKGEGPGESAPERPEAGPPARPRETAHQSLVGRISTELADLGWPGDGGDVVMNVRSPVASYWRGLVLDRYDGTTWSPSPGLPRGGIEGVKRGAGKIQYWQTYYIQTRAPVPLFTGYVPAQVSLPRSAVKVDQTAGAPPRYLFPDKRPYKSLSWVPGFDPRELRRDTARHRSLAYLALPPVSARLRALAERLVLPAATDFDKAVRLEQFLRQNYGYGQDPDPIEPGEETTDSFIFLQESGICTNFSSAMTVMARLVGLPARVALGYRPGTYDLWSGTYVVRTGDAHAWVEIYFQDHGWVPFDPTPLSQEQPSALPLPRWNTPGLWQSGQFVLSLNNPGTAALGKLTGFEGWGETKTWALVVLAFASVLALAGALGRRRLRPGSGPSHASFEYSQLQDLQRRKVIGLFRKMEAVLAKAGFRRRGPGETIAEYGTAAGGLLSPQQEAIKWLAETASRAAYDPRPFSKDLVGEAVRRVENITRAVARSPGRGMTGGP